MKIGIHQPNFFPWIGFFEKFREVDKFIILDDVSFSKGSRTNRVEIELDKKKTHWLSCPVSIKSNTPIKDVYFSNQFNWRQNHIKVIKQNYSKEKNFEKYYNDFTSLLLNDDDNLLKYNMNIISYFLKLFNIDIPIYYQSQLNVVGTSNELLIKLIKKLDGTEYISGHGSDTYLNSDLFKKNRIYVTKQSLSFLKKSKNRYSILDVLMRSNYE